MICPRCGKEVTGSMYCLNCGLKVIISPNAQKTTPKSFFKKAKLAIMATLIGAFILVSFQTASSIFASKPAPPQKIESQKESVVQLIDYNGKQHEMLEAFNNLFSSENNFTPIYAGVAYDSSMDTLIPKVNDNWHLLSEDAKIAFVKTSFISWNTMAKARKIDLKTDKLHISVISSLSGKEVASWGPILGTSINR